MKNLIIIAASLLALGSCTQVNHNKDYNTNLGKQASVRYQSPKKMEEPMVEYTSYMDDLAPQIQFKKVTVDWFTEIRGDKGTVIYFGPNCLQTKKGDTVTGDVDVELIELYSKSDLVAANKPTTADGAVIESGGTIYLKISQNGKELECGCDSYTIDFPYDEYKEGMETFMGAVDKKGNINWLADKSQEVKTESLDEEEFVEEEYYEDEEYWEEDGDWSEDEWEDGEEDYVYSLMPKSFGWINCDRWYDDERPKVELVAELKTPVSKDMPLSMYLVFEDIQSVVSVYKNKEGVYVADGIPVGEKAKLLSISANEEVSYYNLQEVELSAEGAKAEVILEITTKEDITKMLASLDN